MMRDKSVFELKQVLGIMVERQLATECEARPFTAAQHRKRIIITEPIPTN